MVTHQKWSGANYVDNLLKMVTGGISSTSAMAAGVTEDQFKLEKEKLHKEGLLGE